MWRQVETKKEYIYTELRQYYAQTHKYILSF